MTTPVCPVEFMLSPSGNTCIVKCPTMKNYTMTSKDSILSCTHSTDKTATVQLMPTPSFDVRSEWVSYASAVGYTGYPASHRGAYEAEIKRFSDAIAVADANIDKSTKLSTAFNKLQAAENARDTAPDAYQTARVAYYTLLKGDTWINEEKNRVANSEAQPIINNLVDKYKNLQYTRSRQQGVIDSMNNVKQSVLSVKDDLDFSVSNFQRHIEDIKNQINKDKRDQDIQLAKATSWIEVLLNWLIALASLIAIFFLMKYFTRSKPGQAPSDSDIMSYLRRSAFGSQPTTPMRR
jgi:hypothetical protein